VVCGSHLQLPAEGHAAIYVVQHCPTSFDIRVILQKPDNWRAPSNIMVYKTKDSQAVTDLHVGQIGHGLGPRAFGGPAKIFPI